MLMGQGLIDNEDKAFNKVLARSTEWIAIIQGKGLGEVVLS
jgi:hypothetical protein